MKNKLVLSIAIITMLFPAVLVYSAHNVGEDPIEGAGLEAVAALITMADNDNPDDVELKTKAIRRLGELEAEDGLPVVIDSIGYGSSTIITVGNTLIYPWKVRVASALAIAQICNANPDSELVEDAVDELAWASLNDDEVTVRRASVQALGMMGELARTEDVLIYLHDILDRTTDNGLASDICEALGEIGDPASFVPLLRVTQGDFLTYVKENAQEAIGLINWNLTSVFDEED